jgi:hypothetical protein
MNTKSAYTIVPPLPPVRAVQDEWGMFDPNQAGLKAAFRAANAINTPAVRDNPMAQRRDRAPERGLRDSAPEHGLRDKAREVSSAPVPREEVYELSVPDVPPPTPKTTDRGAVYTLEFPTNCPQCCKKIHTVRVSRLIRTQVSFTSTLPRKGYIIVCPECDGMLSAELSGLI